MRLPLLSVAVVALALASASAVKAEEANKATDLVSEVLGEEGKPIQFFDSKKGDHDFDDDDDEDPTQIQPVRRSKKHKHKHSKKKSRKSTHSVSVPKNAKLMCSGARVTWYASHDLENPQCGNGDWNPTNNSHIGAVMYGWQNGPKCGEFVTICNKNDSCIRVRIVDKCAGCKERHIDLTKSAFKQIDPDHSLNTGVVKNLKVYYAGKPQVWDKALFGPLNLK